MVSINYAIELLKMALELYTPSRSEAALANMLKTRCSEELGFEQTYIDSVGNILATRGTGDPKILLCGHMDTVPGRIPVRIDGGYLYGRGASDAKAALISMLLAASEFPKQKGTISFVGVVDEEGNATGVKNLVASNLPLDYAIFGEPSGIHNITIAYKGRVSIRLTCDVGNSAHASAPWLSKNSIEEIYDFWTEIKSEVARISADENKTKTISCSLTEIVGGSSHNVTPRKTSTGDMNILGNAFKIPVVTYGPGEPHASHTVDERVNLEEYHTSIDIFSRALFHISRLHARKSVS